MSPLGRVINSRQGRSGGREQLRANQAIVNDGRRSEPMCYAQIGGLTAATFITLLLVPVIYAIFVRDLKIVKWEKT
jgi:hypothetical protein